jgi:hypothetical protein
VTDQPCAEFRDVAAELALGVADARERAAALAHLQRCPSCQLDLSALSDVADGLVALTPPAEPSAGFESRLLASLDRGRQPAARRHPGPPRVLRVAAGVLVAVVVGVGGWVVGDRNARPVQPPAGSVVTAQLLADQHPAGQVVLATGAEPWVAMAVAAPVGTETVRCQLRGTDGRTLTLGSFTLSHGYGYWAAPVGTLSSRVQSAQLVDANGHVIASAWFRPLTL